MGGHSAHWEGGLELRDVHIAIRRGEWSQSACDAGEKREESHEGILAHQKDKALYFFQSPPL